MMRFLVTLFAIFSTIYASAQTYQVEEVNITAEKFNIAGINSKYDDFSPAVRNNQLIFASGRETSLVLAGENNWRKTGYLNLFAVDLKKGWSDTSGYKNIRPFSDEIKTDNHTGPASFSITGDTIFFTQVKPKQKSVKADRKPQLYMATNKSGVWSEKTYLAFCSQDYSFAQPSWDLVHHVLYFVSDLPGGKGGKDIYRTAFKNGAWDPIENVAEVNTEFDEIFPCYAGGDLYFSSNRPGGAGGFDLYCKILKTEQDVINLSDLNSEFDEVGIYVSPERKKGFYSSNPEGHDDLYFFYMKRSVTVMNEMAGQFIYRNLNGVASGLTIQLYSEEGELLFEQQTNEAGEFQFKKLPGQTYTIKAVSEDNLELALYNSDGVATTYLLRDNEGAFQYKKIQGTGAGTLALMDESMIDFELQTGWISGQFAYENDPGKQVIGLDVFLLDEKGQIAFKQTTDSSGNFDFKKISTLENYILTTEDIDQNLILFIYDKEGNVVAQLKQNESGGFTYRKIRADYVNNLQALSESDDVFELNTMTLTGDFDYKKLEGYYSGGLEVMLYDSDGIYITSTFTDENGEFRFTSLDPDLTYLFKINEENLNFDLGEFTLYVTDRYGNVVADLYREESGFFNYRKLDTNNQNTLTAIKENEVDFTLNITNRNLTASAVVYFDKNSSYPSKEEYLKLSEIITYLKQNPKSSVIISAYADSRSTNEYNQFLSEKRGNRIKDYLISKGVKSSQIKVTAYGETKLVNQCTDENSCDEEEHAKNRRAEVIVQE